MAGDLVRKLTDSDTLVDILIQMEDFLDNMDLYAFDNWFDGVIVEGPDISRYWLSIVLMYDYDDMPDPAGALRLVSSGLKVEYKKASMEDAEQSGQQVSMLDLDQIMTLQGGQDSQGTTLEPYDYQESDEVLKEVWLVRITIPRQFIDELNDINLNAFDSDVQDNLEDQYKIDKQISQNAPPTNQDAPMEPPATTQPDDDMGGME